MAIVNLTKDNFEQEVLKSDKPVLVDFWAAWCGPCKMLSPLIDEIAQERSDIKVGKVNVDEESALAMEYKVVSIPMLLLFKNGEAVKKSVGFVPKEQVLALLED